MLAGIVAIYWPVYHFDFLNYDDAEYVWDNLRVHAGLTGENIAWAFRTTFFENWHPLTWLSFMLDSQLFGLRPGAFHLVNVFFHALTALLLFAVCKRMTSARWPSALVAALFACHPLHVEAVAWVAERKEVLSAFFGMLTLWSYVWYVERPRLGRYLGALLFFALALMAKPMLVTLPFLLLLLDFWPLRRVDLKASRASGRVLVEKIPFFILTLLSCGITYVAQHGARTAGEAVPLASRLANALVSYARYLGKTIWPKDLAIFYPYPSQWPNWEVLGAALMLLFLTALVLRSVRTRPYLTVGWLWFVGTLVPVIGLVQVGGQSMADRYMYVPMIGLLISLAWGASELAKSWRIPKAGLALSSGALVLGCLILSSLQIQHWKNSLTIFEHTLAVTDRNAAAHDYLGDALLELGRTNEAVGHFSAALQCDPKDFMAYGNLGNIQMAQGRPDEAIVEYRKALELNPKSPELNHNVGLCLASQGKFSEALGYYSTALQYKAEFAAACLDLANALLALKKFDEAAANYNKVLRFQPNLPGAHFNLANALLEQGKFQEAAAHYLEVLRLRPDYAEAHENLGLALARQGKNGEALTQLSEAVRLKPAEGEFHLYLAIALDADKKTAEAIAQYEEALRLKPNLVLALNNLAWLLATHSDPRLRNGAQAITYAERARALSGGQQAFLLGTLAAAYAEGGRFSEAISTAQKAVELASGAGQNELAAKNRELIEVYRAGKAYREGEQR